VAAAVMQGIPVVFTASDGIYFAAQTAAPNASKVPVAGTTAVKTLTVYTSNLGEAFAQARFTKTGTGTITMTAGGKTATVSVTVATDDGFAHSIVISDATSAADQPATLTATVKDPFGNVASGVDVSFVATGGVFLNGLNAVTGTTDSNGQVIVQVGSSDKTKASTATVKATVTETSLVGTLATDPLVTTTTLAIGAGVSNKTGTVTFSAPTASTVNAATETAINAVKTDVKAVSDTVATLSKAVTTIQSSVTELTTSFTAQIKSLSAAIAKISKAIAALSKKIK
jgi:alpha-amylase